jgi:N-acyl-D-aspartate/D-glutamate deacylase
MPSTVIEHVSLYDGSARAPRAADVLAVDDRIAAIEAPGGLSTFACDERIDAAGLALCPGFVDLHTHSDATLLVDGGADSELLQGVTTEVIGNCGHSCAPLVQREDIRRLALGTQRGFDVDWTAFDGYLTRLQAARPGTNVAALVGHGALRCCAMCGAPRPASADEVRAMQRLLDESLDAGACGFSTGLEYAPGNMAAVEEIEALCVTTARRGAIYTTHVRNRDARYASGVGEALDAARRSGVRTQISHLQPKYGAPAGAAVHCLEMIAQARAGGADVGYDIIPHTWGPTMMASVLPAWAHAGGPDALLSRLADPGQREALKQNPQPLWQLVVQRRWDDIVLFHCESAPALVGMTMAEIGRRRGTDPHDAALDILRDEGDALYAASWAGHNFVESDVALLLRQAEAGVISDAVSTAAGSPLDALRWSPSSHGWTARFLCHYAHEQRLMSREEAVHRLTGLPAQRLGLTDRGRIEAGAVADLVLLDFDALADQSSLADPLRSPSGVRHVMVNGAWAVRDGVRTRERSGRVLRRR